MGDLTPLIQEVEVEGEMKRALGADVLEGALLQANDRITLGLMDRKLEIKKSSQIPKP